MTSARSNGYLCCVRESKDLRRQGQLQAIFLVTEPLVRQKRHNKWFKRVNHVIDIYTV